MNMAAEGEGEQQIYLRCVRLQLITVVVPIVRARPPRSSVPSPNPLHERPSNHNRWRGRTMFSLLFQHFPYLKMLGRVEIDTLP